jgi:PLD-like domain
MSFLLIDGGWDEVIDQSVEHAENGLKIVCPFIKHKTVQRLFKLGNPASIQVITRFNLSDFCSGVNDISALRLLAQAGAEIRGIRNLHAKLYLFGDSRAIVTSANLTESALTRNCEFGFLAYDDPVVEKCHSYFSSLWNLAQPKLEPEQLDLWEKQVIAAQCQGAGVKSGISLGDYGTDIQLTPNNEPSEYPWHDVSQGFVKFFGGANRRADRSLPVLQEVKNSGSHWACSYPENKRPRSVNDGDLMFIARLVKNPADIVIYGRAIAIKHQEGRDDATPEEISLREFRQKWPVYIRVHHAEFVAGSLQHAISLREMMETLGENSFAATQQNAAEQSGNINPRKAFLRQAQVRLSPQGIEWINARLERAFQQHGKIPTADLAQLDWPNIDIPS